MTLLKNKPFLKWAGNKYRVMDKIQKLLPEGKRLIEPFAGSTAVFLNTRYDEYLLADNNIDLINLYNLLKKNGADFIKYCQPYFSEKNNTEAAYYAFRQQFNTTRSIKKKAALFLYLNRHGYNGLCRYNLKGGYNVPFGRYKKPYFPAREMLTFADKAQSATFIHQDFVHIMQQAKKGDVIYCDPPYAPISASASFTQYSAGGFNLEQQQQLANIASQKAEQGVPVLISNHNTSFTLKTYNQAQTITKFKVQRYISCNGNKRDPAGELLALFV
ncbi:Methyl-directed repair DNA adenine methylase [hydrothermal vent metagenome]|uniref:site-specific DNA-methyltransferase (adenine-specific) n=1 Tax=hydrothermal vent metagenome TaxID=652676 RepID=A0A3B0ZVB6_9ZZZZ